MSAKGFKTFLNLLFILLTNFNEIKANVVRNPFGPWLDFEINKILQKMRFLFSDISLVSYNIWLTMIGQLAAFL